MTIKVTGEEVFQVPRTNFAISPSTSGYNLGYSADAVNFTQYPDAVPANENLIVNESAANEYYKLVGNSATVTVMY